MAFLSRYAGAAWTPQRVSSMPSLVASVAVLRKAIRVERVAVSAELSETSVLGLHDFHGPYGSISYSYQRSDLTRTGIEWLPEIHGRATERASGGLFFSSGMSAIAALLAVLSNDGVTDISTGPWRTTRRTFWPDVSFRG